MDEDEVDQGLRGRVQQAKPKRATSTALLSLVILASALLSCPCARESFPDGEAGPRWPFANGISGPRRSSFPRDVRGKCAACVLLPRASTLREAIILIKTQRLNAPKVESLNH